MNIHEYQAKELFRKNGIDVPRGLIARSGLEAEFAFQRLKSPLVVVKAQIHAGGRGKAGGVKLCKTADECRTLTEEMLQKTLVTHQTTPEGKKVHLVYIEEGSDIEKEYYLAMVVDRETANLAIMFSTEGGVDIENVADKTPDKILNLSIDPTIGLKNFHFIPLLTKFNLPRLEFENLKSIIKKLYKMFFQYDFSMLEINPLVVTKDQKMMPLDGKMNFDENALFRHPEIEDLRDLKEEEARELEASKYGLSYIGLQGNIGCLVNGAGLAMATMDIIKHYGGEPANFLDVGGGATEEMVKHAFRIILRDPSVKGIFVNIFGGIMRCDVIANGILAAAKELDVKVPIVARLEGTNVDEGKKILQDSKLALISAVDMADGAEKIIKAIK